LITGAPFDLIAADFAGYSDVVPTGVIHAVGYRRNGSTVLQDFAVSDIAFQRFQFNSGFIDLDRVEFPRGQVWSMDNMVIGVPEPTVISLVLVGASLLVLRRKP
jgi:hypothetical protein